MKKLLSLVLVLLLTCVAFAETEEIIIPTEPFVIDGVDLGDYGKDFIFCEGTEDEYAFVGYFLPAGTYSAENPDTVAAQISFFVEGVDVDEDTGIEYPVSGEHSPIVLFGGETKEFEVADGEYIKLPNNCAGIIITLIELAEPVEPAA